MKRRKFITKMIYSIIVILILLFIVSPMVAVVGHLLALRNIFSFRHRGSALSGIRKQWEIKNISTH